jgi:hypothetical protein
MWMDGIFDLPFSIVDDRRSRELQCSWLVTVGYTLKSGLKKVRGRHSLSITKPFDREMSSKFHHHRISTQHKPHEVTGARSVRG